MNNKFFLAVLAVLAVGGAVTGVMMSGGKSDMAAIETAAGEATPADANAVSSGANDGKLSVAVVDVQQLLKDSDAAKSLEGEVKKLRESFGAELQAEEKRLREGEKKLIEARKTLKEEEFKPKRVAFEKDVRDSQQKMRDKREQLEKQIAQSVNTLREQILKIVADMSTSNQYDLVLSRADIVLVSKQIDVTAKVMEKLNDALPKLALGATSAPAQAEAQPAAPAEATAAAAPAPAPQSAVATPSAPAVTAPQATEPAAGQ